MISTSARSSPANASTVKCSFASLSNSETAQISGRCMSAVHRAMCSGVTSSSTSMRFAALPPMAPMSTAARTPLSPFVLGTMTDLTFLRILPHTATENRSGRTPSTSRARALA